jgi:hypothetical protein
MGPHCEEPEKALPPSAEQKPKRFRIVKLEERIAPSNKGGNTAHNKSCACMTYGWSNCDGCY